MSMYHIVNELVNNTIETILSVDCEKPIDIVTFQKRKISLKYEFIFEFNFTLSLDGETSILQAL